MPKLTIVYVAMEVINPEWQVPVAVYARLEDAIKDGHNPDDLEEVVYYG